MSTHEPRRRRGAWLVAGVIGTAVLGLTATSTLGASAFSAQIDGTGKFQSGTLLLSKTNASGTCLSSSNSAGTITTNINTSCDGNDIAATNQVIGADVTSTLTLTNQGSIDADGGLTLENGECTTAAAPWTSSPLNPASSGSDTAGFCGKVWVTLYDATAEKCILPEGPGACPAPTATHTLASLASTSYTLVSSLDSGTSLSLVITTRLGTTASNADQGLAASMPMTFKLAQ